MTILLAPDWRRIRAHYDSAPPALWEVRDEWIGDPYEWDFAAGILLTPIERSMWDKIRLENLIFYPQFPVLRYFVDFANPAARVVIECDGRAYHADEERDARRQREIEVDGWTVYRFTGSECHDDAWTEWDDLKERDVIRIPPARVRLREMGLQHGINRFSRTPESVAKASAAAWRFMDACDA